MIGDRVVKTPLCPPPPPKRETMNQEIAQSLAKQVIALMDKNELIIDDFYKANAIVSGALMMLESTR